MIVDVQQGMFALRRPLHQGDEIVQRIAGLLGRAARSLDYEVVLVADGHSTYDTPVLSAGQIIAHHNRLLADGFVALAEAEQVQFQRSPS